MTHVDALTNFTQQALLDTKKATEALNEEQKQMRNAILQNRMALDIITAAQDVTCTVIKVECCVYIPDYSSNLSDAVNDLKHHIFSMQDSSPSFWEQVKSWFMSDWWQNLFIIFVVVLCFPCCGPCFLQCIMNLVTERIMKFSHILKK